MSSRDQPVTAMLLITVALFVGVSKEPKGEAEPPVPRTFNVTAMLCGELDAWPEAIATVPEYVPLDSPARLMFTVTVPVPEPELGVTANQVLFDDAVQLMSLPSELETTICWAFVAWPPTTAPKLRAVFESLI